jgi:hypothetical protein
MYVVFRSAVVDPLPSPALTRDKGTPHEDTDQDDSEEDQSEEETHSSPAKKKSPIKKKSKDKTQGRMHPSRIFYR